MLPLMQTESGGQSMVETQPSGFRSYATTALPFVASPSTAASGTEQAPANRQHWGTAASVVVELLLLLRA